MITIREKAVVFHPQAPLRYGEITRPYYDELDVAIWAYGPRLREYVLVQWPEGLRLWELRDVLVEHSVSKRGSRA